MSLSKAEPFDRSGATTLTINQGVEPRRAIHSSVLAPDGTIKEFRVANWCGPNSVWTVPPHLTGDEAAAAIRATEDWSPHDRRRADYLDEWTGYERDGYLAFLAPYALPAATPILWAYEKHLQIGVSAEEDALQKTAINHRTSLVVAGLKDLVQACN